MNNMNYFRRVLITFFFLIPILNAANEPLNVGITSFGPPFVMHGSHNEVFGFDIDMMNSLCKILQRTCQYHVMRFDQLLTAVANNTVDVAVSAITITPERSKIVNFSLPYLLSYSRFLTKSPITQGFSLELLNNKTIGIEAGTIFADQIKSMGVKNPTIREFERSEDLLEELRAGNLDFVLLDSPTTLYWEANSAGAFVKVGPAYMYGFGLGIATNPSLLTPPNPGLTVITNTNFNRWAHQVSTSIGVAGLSTRPASQPNSLIKCKLLSRCMVASGWMLILFAPALAKDSISASTGETIK